jgi:hypothetical protein
MVECPKEMIPVKVRLTHSPGEMVRPPKGMALTASFNSCILRSAQLLDVVVLVVADEGNTGTKMTPRM